MPGAAPWFYCGSRHFIVNVTETRFSSAHDRAREPIIKLLGIDIGTGGTRALVIDEQGQVVASATEEHAPFTSPQIGWAEQQPEDWWRACGLAVRKALAQASLGADDIACVGFSGQMHGAVMLDDQDRVVRPALIWCDVRTEDQCRELNRKMGAERIIQLTSNPALTNFTLTKFLWVQRARARELEARPLGHAAQGLRPFSPDRRSRHRYGGRLRHPHAGCCQAPLVA